MAADPAGIGEFVIDSLLGEGGMGKVYRARQVALDRWVALKVLANAKDNRDFIERFYREARSAARLVHPNIIQIHTVGEHEGIPYFAMEYVEGIDLEKLARTDPEQLSIEEALEVLRCVAKALTVAAEEGIVHRDIKPGNIMLTKSGLVKVMDFGLAKGASSDLLITQPGLVVGTPTYMSPEQGSGRQVDIRSDIYSLGCVFYEGLCGRPPFNADNVAAMIYKHAYEAPEAPSSIREEIPPEIERLCLQMIAKRPEDRFQTPDDILMALAQVPFNPGFGEILLAKRVGRMLAARKQKPKAVVVPSAEPAAPGRAPAPPGSGSVVKSPASSSKDTVLTPAPAPSPPALTEQPVVRERRQGTATLPAKTPGSSLLRTILTPPPAPPPAAVREQPVVESRQRPPAAPPEFPESSRLQTMLTPPPAPMPPPRPVSSPQPAAGPTTGASRGTTTTRTGLGSPTRKFFDATEERSTGVSPATAGGTPAVQVSPSQPAETAAVESALDTKPRSVSAVLRRHFLKLPDGHWSYKAELGSCSFAEGLAATIKQPPGGTTGGLGDCLLCANWNKRVGCALAYAYDLAARNRYEGLKLLVEQAIVWTGAGRFDRAIGLLDDYVKSHPEDPQGFRELARVYDRPDFRGREKRRAIVLYKRFAELAQLGDSYTGFEIARAEERAKALLAAPADTKASVVAPGTGVAFQCFYRATIVCFGYGVLTAERLLIARAGDADPESGLTATDMGSVMGRATTIFRRLKSEKAKKEAVARVKDELARLSSLTVEELAADQACVVVVSCSQITGAEMTTDQATGIRCITIQAGDTHQLLFPEDSAFKAEQCYELLRRMAPKQPAP